jgi:hypothetical protein
MFSYLFGIRSPLGAYLSNNTAPRPCTSWYGHRFEKFDAETIFCPICGDTRKVKP